MPAHPPATPSFSLRDALAALAAPAASTSLEEALLAQAPGHDLLLFDRVADCATGTERRAYLGRLQAHFSSPAR
ncbi:MAG: hypothetical protein CVV05_00705 [Gammaproteobacteria bacterium HGW-Gammaproteobacteria-1]|jgi:hypothetical protein|nr:MAG: hypothetical protein CVV05_00705 [Gammaproteobacteria bacterium HGW-Gammaproteobacteria-1]